MPRPAARRTRPTSKAASASTKRTAGQGANRKDETHESTDTTNLPTDKSRDVTATSLPADNAPESSNNTTLQARNQTPMSKTNEQAIESSPMGERTATGSRHLTRARGYSSTLSLAGRKGDASSKVPGTPAFESSVLSNFRRRARQPSILQVMQTEGDSSDLDDDDFLGGLSPEDESTPLNVSRGKSLVIRNAVSPSPQSSPPESDSSRKRKRAAEKIQVPQSPVGIVESTPLESQARGNPEIESQARVDESQALKSPEAFSQTMAPPASSSAPQSPASTTILPAPDQLSPEKEPSRQATGDPEHLTTEALQNKLLPRRRQPRRKQRSTAEFEASSDDNEDEDNDELNDSSRRPSKTQRKGVDKSRSSSRAKTRQGKQRNVSKPSAKGNKNASRTVEVDKENQPADMSSPLSSAVDSDAFDSDEPTITPKTGGKFMSEELRLQANKFAEVDKWQMDFEDVMSNTGSQGSPFR